MSVPISNVVRRVVFAPSGTGPYAFTFEILAATDIQVYKGDTLLTLTTDYTVTINTNGTGSVTLVATAGTDNITIVGARTIQRTTDFVTGGDLFANSLNTELDSLTIFTQQNSEANVRSIKAPVTDPTTINMILPTKTDRANKVLSFNSSTGNPETTITVTAINNAASDAAAAAASASAAASSASAASGSASAAAGSASSASSSASSATSSASAASASASAASTSETNAASSASAASTSASNASTSASNASTSASNASTSATNAANSATAAQNAQTAAESARDSTLAAFDSFDDRYLGTKTSDPTLDNDGNALVAGALYFNSVDGVMKVYTGSAWVAAYVSGTGFVDLASAQTITGVKTFDNGLATDTISEETSAAGVTVDGVLLKDSQVSTDQINEKTSAAGVTIDGVLLKDSEVTTDVIKEKTSAAGVTIDSVLLKDNKVTANELTINSNNISADNSLGFRNRIINGDMRIDQRNAGASVTVNTGPGPYSVDRWTTFGQTSDGVFTLQQNAGSVTPPEGFVNYLGATVTTADASIGATQVYRITQFIEGLNCADLSWGTANAKTITLSFWVRSSLTGTFGGSLGNNGFTRAYPFNYTISAANTWEYKTVTIAGDTTGTWLTTNGIGIAVSFVMGMGATYTGTANAWNAGLYFAPTGTTNIIATNGATFYITGVQLEVGSVATPFERRPYGTELSLCQRYYYRINADVNFGIFGVGQCSTTTGTDSLITFPVPMRASPSALEQTGTASNYRIFHSDTGTACNGVPSFSVATNTRGANVSASVASGLTQGRACYLQSNNNTSAYLAWSAEL